MYQITIGCQLEILMVTERLLENKFRVLSQNTDGLDLIFKRDRLDQFFNLMNELEIEIGNDKIGNFEYTEFEWFAQLTVNDYLAKKKGEWINRVFYPHKSKDEGDHLKAKGDMEYWKELNKNSSFSIIPLTLQNYFDKGIDYAEFIENHNDIFDFCARSNAGWDFDHVEFSNNSNKKLPKLVRYYVGKKGVNVMKVVKENCLTNANDTNIRPATKLKTVCNTLIKSTWKEHLDNVDRQWYIDEVELMIKSILSSKKKTEIKIVPKIQLKIDF